MNITLISDKAALLAIIKSLPGNFLILLPDAPRFTIVEVSDEYNRATFTKREDIIGSAMFEVFPDDPADLYADGVANLNASFHTVISTRQSHEMGIQRYPVQDGVSNTFVEKFWAPVNKPVIVEGEVAYIIHSVTDVTESRLLKSREQYFMALAEQSPFMIWRSAGASCIYVNNAWMETTGLSYEDSLGSGHLKAFHPDDIPEQRKLFAGALESRTSYETKYRIFDAEGKIRWVFMKVTPLLMEGATIEFVGSMIDITDQEIAAQRVIESETQFRQMADSIIQMIWVTDAEGMHEYYNQRWYDFTGATHEQTEGEGWNQVFHPDDQERAWKVWRHSLDTGEPYEIEYRLRKYTGEYVWVLGRAAPYYDNDGKILKWFGTCTDINEQKLLQQQKDDFINIASHELKTPLTSLSANIQFLQKMVSNIAGGSPMLEKLVLSSVTNVRKLNKLIDELLNANSIGLGQLTIWKENFDLVALVKDSVAYLSNDNQPVVITGEETAKVFGDPVKVEQIVVNLVNNAHKYARESKYVEVNVQSTSSGYMVRVIDQGPGIKEDQQKFLFDRYYQAENRVGRNSGMGLGLFICASIVKAHHGEIGVESEPGKGSIFWFTLLK
ncbi:PAS domain-containing sensor histidine kinase [Mucilaginibacter pallidiroseus]|uniref:histidine kinase n=1 Tax=Mucilaginibacter pallidiroseus TaxID=2599295 RepID=A0A563UI42_9SPHI|nr:PAS domain-containing sensor histidine kinase [Mucilaginibacter pallidiroseus]TWR30949.1 PAS domain-containing sensor histidine kinase [Mucilaginibacter pallidiroseus]